MHHPEMLGMSFQMCLTIELTIHIRNVRNCDLRFTVLRFTANFGKF